MLKYLKYIALAFCCCAIAFPAYAACSSPAGIAGEMGYNETGTNKYQYCDGTNWIDMYDTSSSIGLVGHWKLDETSGTTAIDSAGSNHGTMENGLNANAHSTTGQIENAIDFELSNNQYINVGSDSSLDNLGPLTISAWINSESFTNQGGFGIAGNIFGTDILGAATGYIFYTTPAGGIGFFIDVTNPSGASGANVVYESASNTMSVGSWNHVAVTWDGAIPINTGSIRLYINGTETTYQNINNATGSIDDSTRDKGIGGAYEGTFETFFDGLIDEVRVYNRVLSAAEIMGLLSSCTDKGKMDYNTTSHLFQWCDNNHALHNVSDTNGAGGAGCAASGSLSAGLEGTMQYDTANNKMVFCGGTSWINIPN